MFVKLNIILRMLSLQNICWDLQIYIVHAHVIKECSICPTLLRVNEPAI